jgi:acyl carrier protein
MDTLTQLRAMLQERLGSDPAAVVPEATLESLGVDSLMLLDLMFEFEEKLSIQLPQDLPRPTTVAELLATFAELQKAART